MEFGAQLSSYRLPWPQVEATVRTIEAYGWDFPGVRERCDRLEEAAQLIRLLFTKQDDEKVSFEGNYYRLDEAPLAPGSTRPRSTRNAHIPILIGGNGEKRTLRTCARYGDISNLDFWHPGGVDVFRHKQEVLDRHCEDAGRDPAEVKRTVALPFRLFANDQEARKSPGRPWYCWGAAPSIQDLLQQYIKEGAEEIILCGVPNQPESWQQIDQEILTAFD